ncbi:MAG: glycosyltransferase [Candidatus Micrarchaeaceae archaeon]
MRLSIIVPTKNESIAPKTIKELRNQFGSEAEIIVVDKSDEKHYLELRSTGAKVIRQASTGYEDALMQGFRAARGEILSSIDPDGTYRVDEFKKVVEKVSSGEADFCSGNRFGKLSDGAMTASIAFGNKFLTGLFRFLYHKNIHDGLSGAFAMTRKAFDSIREEEPYRAGTLFFEIELARRGFRLMDIPISYSPRIGSESKIAKVKPVYGLNIARNTIRYARDYNPLLIFGTIGAILMLAGLVLGALVITNYLHTGSLSEIGRALIAFMLVTLGFLSIISGLMLDLLLQIEKILIRNKK